MLDFVNSALGPCWAAEWVSQPSTATSLVLTFSGQFQWFIFLRSSICTAGWKSSVRLWEASFCAHRFLKLQLDGRQLLGTNLFIFDFANSGLHSGETTESMSRLFACNDFLYLSTQIDKLMALLVILNSSLHLKLPALGWQKVSWSQSAKGSVMYVGCWYLLEVCHSAIYWCEPTPTNSIWNTNPLGLWKASLASLKGIHEPDWNPSQPNILLLSCSYQSGNCRG